MTLLTAPHAKQLDAALRRGLAAFAKPERISLDAWARQYFYLSAESSYVEQAWTPWPFQSAILNCMSNDDIREIDFKKSARVGYTKMLLACICYTAHHLRRNQVIWQPTDDDIKEFVKTEIDPVLRDIPVMREVMPNVHRRDKANTLEQKNFIGSILHTKGGKAEKNYRRISVDTAYFDEISAFDLDIENTGDPYTHGSKRVEGASFPKINVGSTPAEKGKCHIDARYQRADARFHYNIPCPHCGEFHPITWGGKDETHGIKWRENDPATVGHLCPTCGVIYTQTEYLRVEHNGIWISEDRAIHIHADGRFTDPDGIIIRPPAHIAFHIWTAYSPAVPWASIVRDFLAAHADLGRGDDKKMKAFTLTTLGECWEGEIERTDVNEIKSRAEPTPLRHMPRGCLLLLCGADVQGNRIEAQVWGFGPGGEMWTIDHRQFFGNPEQADVWHDLEEFLFDQTYPHACGGEHPIYATAIDSGGTATDAVYAFAHKHRARRVFAIRGFPGIERAIEQGNTKVDFNWQGRREKHGTTLWHVGTNLAKDRLAARLLVGKPGPGYIHLSADNTDEWFAQLAAEDRVPVQTRYGTRMRWTPNRKRNEVLDMTAYVIWLEERLDLLSPRKRAFWAALEQKIQPHTQDLFLSLPTPEKPATEPIQRPPVQAPAPARIPVKNEWSVRL
jgi:phage terminase large subunit GpA-like protein